jgi:hypothetical protein
MPTSDVPDLLVACLCAQWCGSCRDYRALFQRQAESQPGARWLWVDIEDQAEVLGDIDIDDFPTLCILRGSELLFFGSVTPHVQTLQRLVRSAAQGELAPLADAPLIALAERLRRLGA